MSKKLCKKKSEGQILSYPLVIRCEHSREIASSLRVLQKVTNNYLGRYYQPEVLEILSDSNKKAYKVLEPLGGIWKKRLPSRINRCVLETTGRVLRTMSARKNLFDLLVRNYGEDPSKWDYRKLIKDHGIYVKSLYVKNLAEQIENFVQQKHQHPKNFFDIESHPQRQYPKDFFEFQGRPRLKSQLLTFAPDDGQAIEIEKAEDHLFIRLKILQDEKWQWITVCLPLPEFLRSYAPAAPDIRMACIHGEWLPVLDYKIRCPEEKKQKSPYFVTVDWGTRKLITVGVFDRKGNQICPPIFLKFEPIQEKLKRIRSEIDDLKSQRDKLPKNSSLWQKYNREIAKRWRKFRALQQELAHLASSVIVLIAQIYGCCEIYVEWLKGLKSQKLSPSLNWIINTTVRETIYEKVAYKAKLVGIEFKRPVQPYGTSQYCPRCGKKGFHTRAPNQTARVRSGGWFFCPSCGFNADRDYVACCNLARKVLYGNLSDNSHSIAYKAITISDLLFRQSSCFRKRLRQHLKGWKGVISLQPQKFFCGTLRS